MPSGFVTRTKGKVSVGAIYPLQELPSVMSQTSTGGYSVGGVLSTTIDPGGVTIIRSTAAAPGVLTLGPPETGTYKTIVVSSQSSGAVIIKTNSTGVTFFDGVNSYFNKGSSSFGDVTALHLVAISTSQWAVIGVFPPGSTGTSMLSAAS